MKKLIVLVVLGLALVGCGSKDDTPKDETPDVVTVASIVDNAEALEKSLAADGNWITAALNDVTLDKELTVTGMFHDKGVDTNDVYRKLALHTQDDKFNILDNFTLETPKLIVDSENFTVFYGTIKGDVLVKANGFTLVGTKVEGNIEFASEENKETAELNKDDLGAEVTGEIIVSE